MRKLLEAAQRVRVDVLPHHFYGPIPDIRELRRNTGWRGPKSMQDVRSRDLAAQVDWLHDMCDPVASAAAGCWERACHSNGEAGYGHIEAIALHAFIAAQRPSRVLQVGAGVSTAIILEAADVHGVEVEVTCVDPFPTDYLRRLAAERRVTLLDVPVQRVSLDRLRNADLLFVDSTHAVKPGSDVNHLILDVLPCVEPHTWLHFHDIYWPYDYSAGALRDDVFWWSESALLLAFMKGNDRFEVQAAMRQLHTGSPHAFQAIFPDLTLAPMTDGLATGEGFRPSAAYLRARGPAAPTP